MRNSSLAGTGIWNLTPASVCACTPLLPGKNYKTAFSKAPSCGPHPPQPDPALLLFTCLCPVPDFHLDSQKADEAIAQCTKLKCSCGPSASFKALFSLWREARSPVSWCFLYCLVLGDGQCVCVNNSFKRWVVSQFEQGGNLVRRVLLENNKSVLYLVSQLKEF